MNSSASPNTLPVVPESVHREPAARFVEWALAELDIPFQADEGDLVVSLPATDQAAFGGQSTIRLAAHGNGNGADDREPLDWDGRFGHWLRQRLAQPEAIHARPQQPMAVTDVTAKLFGAYSVEGGQIHLAGCQLTDHPFLRLSFAGDNGDVRHIYVAPDGSSVSDELVPRLGLDELQPILKHPPRLDDAALRSLIAAGRRIAAKQSTSRDPSAATVEPLAAAVLWVRHAEGRLQFTIGAATTDHSFSGWAALLQPEPFFGKESGVSSFKLAATDEGQSDWRVPEIGTPGAAARAGRVRRHRDARAPRVHGSLPGLGAPYPPRRVCPVPALPAAGRQGGPERGGLLGVPRAGEGLQGRPTAGLDLRRALGTRPLEAVAVGRNGNCLHRPGLVAVETVAGRGRERIAGDSPASGAKPAEQDLGRSR